MPGQLLTVASSIKCPHGGTAILTTSNARVKAGGAFVLLQSDIHAVVACPFTIGLKYSPCVRIKWSAGAALAKAGPAVLVRSSIGKCFNAENAPQGVAVIVNTQPKAIAR